MVLRQTVWIDRSVQRALISRIVLYWCVGVLYVGLGSACFQYYEHPTWSIEKHFWRLFEQFWPWLPSLILFLPLVIYDIVRLSNLFVGPIYRLRMHLLELQEDPQCRPLSFREDDFWQDLAEPVHCLQADLLSLQAELSRLRSGQREQISANGLTEAQLAALASMDPRLLEASLGTAGKS